jgi:hypothetical protein
MGEAGVRGWKKKEEKKKKRKKRFPNVCVCVFTATSSALCDCWLLFPPNPTLSAFQSDFECSHNRLPGTGRYWSFLYGDTPTVPCREDEGACAALPMQSFALDNALTEWGLIGSAAKCALICSRIDLNSSGIYRLFPLSIGFASCRTLYLPCCLPYCMPYACSSACPYVCPNACPSNCP